MGQTVKRLWYKYDTAINFRYSPFRQSENNNEIIDCIGIFTGLWYHASG